MKKAFALIGSSMAEQSSTKMFAQRIFDKTKEKCNVPVEFEIMTMDQIHLEYCQGCCLCFQECVCATDGLDDMPKIRQKLLEADFIILGSPVYAHQVSGQMKTIIDRLSFWLHLLPLAGKPGLAISTTASTGEMEILNYLVKMMYPMGLKPVGAYNAYAHFQGKFYNEKEVERKAEKAAVTAAKYLNGEKSIRSTPQTEEMFQAMKRMIRSNRDYKSGEYDYWIENKLMDFNTYQELLDQRQQGTKQ